MKFLSIGFYPVSNLARSLLQIGYSASIRR